MEDLVLSRANLIGGMNGYIEDLDDEDIYFEWLYAYPDGTTEDDLMEMAEDDKYFSYLVTVFERCVRMAEK